MHWACKYAGVDDACIAKWRHTATRAETKKPRERSQHERATIQFFRETSQAEADSYMLGIGLIAQAARPSKLVRTEIDDLGQTIRTVTSDITGDWRAMAHLLARRFPRDMGDKSQVEVSGPDGGPIHTVSNDEVWAELEALRRERALGSVVVPTPATNGARGNGSV